MAIKFKTQAIPIKDAERGQIFEDIADGHVKMMNSAGVVTDLQAAVEASPFGQNFHTADRLTEATTSSIALIDHLQLNTPILPAGTYLISW